MFHPPPDESVPEWYKYILSRFTCCGCHAYSMLDEVEPMNQQPDDADVRTSAESEQPAKRELVALLQQETFLFFFFLFSSSKKGKKKEEEREREREREREEKKKRKKKDKSALKCQNGPRFAVNPFKTAPFCGVHPRLYPSFAGTLKRPARFCPTRESKYSSRTIRYIKDICSWFFLYFSFFSSFFFFIYMYFSILIFFPSTSTAVSFPSTHLFIDGIVSAFRFRIVSQFPVWSHNHWLVDWCRFIVVAFEDLHQGSQPNRIRDGDYHAVWWPTQTSDWIQLSFQWN